MMGNKLVIYWFFYKRRTLPPRFNACQDQKSNTCGIWLGLGVRALFKASNAVNKIDNDVEVVKYSDVLADSGELLFRSMKMAEDGLPVETGAIIKSEFVK